MQQPETEKTGGILRPDPLKTDMTAVPSNVESFACRAASVALSDRITDDFVLKSVQ
jgi:hypothetical protein